MPLQGLDGLDKNSFEPEGKLSSLSSSSPPAKSKNGNPLQIDNTFENPKQHKTKFSHLHMQAKLSDQ